jgi:hypothetical protein
MTRLAALLLTAVLLVGSVSALPVAASAAATTLPASSSALQADANATDVAPGQRLAGVVGAGQAEFEGEVERRAYGLQYAQANTNASKAEILRDRLESVRERLQTLEQREAALSEARENGTISEGEYRARVTAIDARSQQLEQLANDSEVRARGLPDDVLASKGINVTEIRTLQQQAANLTGEEVAEIARNIAGPETGRSISDGPPSGLIQPDATDGVPDDRGPDATNESTDATQAGTDTAD